VERGGGLRCGSGLWAAELRLWAAELRLWAAELRLWAAEACGAPLRWWSAGSSAVVGGSLRCGPPARAAASVAVEERGRRPKVVGNGGELGRAERGGAVTPTGFGPGAGREGGRFRGEAG
jgi:hypothetical protein